MRDQPDRALWPAPGGPARIRAQADLPGTFRWSVGKRP